MDNLNAINLDDITWTVNVRQTGTNTFLGVEIKLQYRCHMIETKISGIELNRSEIGPLWMIAVEQNRMMEELAEALHDELEEAP